MFIVYTHYLPCHLISLQLGNSMLKHSIWIVLLFQRHQFPQVLAINLLQINVFFSRKREVRPRQHPFNLLQLVPEVLGPTLRGFACLLAGGHTEDLHHEMGLTMSPDGIWKGRATGWASKRVDYKRSTWVVRYKRHVLGDNGDCL